MGPGSSPRRKDRNSTGSGGGSGRQTPESGGARTPASGGSGGRKSPAKSEGGASDDMDVKRNKSLEALFQVQYRMPFTTSHVFMVLPVFHGWFESYFTFHGIFLTSFLRMSLRTGYCVYLCL